MIQPTDPGMFNEPVAIQAYVRVDDDAGGYTETWTDVASWPNYSMQFEPLSGREQIEALQTTAHATMRARGWTLEGVKAVTHRIRRKRDSAILQIVAPPAYTQDRGQMELLCEEIEVPA